MNLILNGQDKAPLHIDDDSRDGIKLLHTSGWLEELLVLGHSFAYILTCGTSIDEHQFLDRVTIDISVYICRSNAESHTYKDRPVQAVEQNWTSSYATT